MGWMGEFLIRADAPVHADAAVVLAGDPFGHRILRGCELVREGYVPKAYVSGPRGIYGHNEAELAIGFAVARGCPAEWFLPILTDSNSTMEEARDLAQVIQTQPVKRLLVVTTDYHTRRAGKIWRKTVPSADVRMVAARDEYFRVDEWWKTRPAREVAFMEFTKTVAEWVGL
jgi:uncharacterized SAM-binding protein YcdF (DUF218 family)